MGPSRDRWPAILSREQEDLLEGAGFHYDGEPGVLVHSELRKVLSVEAAAGRGVEELRAFASAKRNPSEVELVFEDEPTPGLRESLCKRYGWV